MIPKDKIINAGINSIVINGKTYSNILLCDFLLGLGQIVSEKPASIHAYRRFHEIASSAVADNDRLSQVILNNFKVSVG